MTQYAIPLRAVPSQTETVRLGGQDVRIDVRTKRTGLYIDVYAAGSPIVQGVLCLNLVKIVRGAGLVGDLFWTDTQGTSAPDYTGLAGRFVLVYDDSL